MKFILKNIFFLIVFLSSVIAEDKVVDTKTLNPNESELGINYMITPLSGTERSILFFDMAGNIIDEFNCSHIRCGWVDFERDGSFILINDYASLVSYSVKRKILWKTNGSYHHQIDRKNGRIFAINQKKRNKGYDDIEFDFKDDEIHMLNENSGTLYYKFSLYELLKRNLPEVLNKRFIYIRQQLRNKIMNIKKVDLFHANHIQIIDCNNLKICNEDLGLLISMRDLNLIIITDLLGKKILWSSRQDIFTGQHGVQSTDDGNILIYDNIGQENLSRVLRLNPITNEYKILYPKNIEDEFFCPKRGGIQILPNKNLLITDAHGFKAFEITESGDKVWEAKISLELLLKSKNLNSKYHRTDDYVNRIERLSTTVTELRNNFQRPIF